MYVLGFELSGRETSGPANGTYTLRIKNFDWAGGLGAFMNQGEVVSRQKVKRFIARGGGDHR